VAKCIKIAATTAFYIAYCISALNYDVFCSGVGLQILKRFQTASLLISNLCFTLTTLPVHRILDIMETEEKEIH
jgi:hypothetical protein